ncbi:MAG: riboflavin synthase, partial [Elusimicrobiaceae bacterium]|nr:riboflavin synthase [Elusimicrobiaceae bacterium]
MFTGIITEVGKVSNIQQNSFGKTITISCKSILENSNIGDSIAVNGVCLTVTSLNKEGFSADIGIETLNRSKFKNIKNQDKVNLEKSLTLRDYLSGHLVTGDVEFTAKIEKIIKKGISTIYTISLPNKYKKYVVEKGRITIDGISLTISKLNSNSFDICIIPHTIK